MTHKCECPERADVAPGWEGMYSAEEKAGMHHEPHACTCVNDLARYDRNGTTLWLCSCCNLRGDVRLQETAQ
jgi:hypothetical protein